MFNKKNIFGNSTQAQGNFLNSRESDMTDGVCTYLESLIYLEGTAHEIITEQITDYHYYQKYQMEDILLESTNKFAEGVKDFFKKMAEKFKEAFKKIYNLFSAYIGDFDKFYQRNKDALLSKKYDMTIHGYKYTITKNIPDISVVETIVNKYNSQLSDLEKLSKADLEELKDTEILNENRFNIIRGDILGKSDKVLDDDFNDELKSVFRNGETDKEDIQVDKQYISNIIKEYDDFKIMAKEAIKERDRVIVILENLKNFFEKGYVRNYDGKSVKLTASQIELKGTSVVTTGQETRLNNVDSNVVKYKIFFNTKFVESKKISVIVTSSCIQKVNALKEAVKQHKDTIRQAYYQKTIE